ncbi:methionine ABC transporter permease [Erysipelotrichaceae bacterium 51-3]|uniref:methionine ABC transporter permease n=1 Tax=Allobaculum sp. JKK-2023 TaxID=3108943 RepID=UPI002B056824|nr:methionine ABC transporter permease [Allobaculum sp. JKK-2023]
MDTLTNIIPNVIERADMFPQAIIDTLTMLTVTGVVSFVIGLPIAVIVVITKPEGICPNRIVFWILDKIINLFRAIPFVILIPLLVGVTRFFFHTTIGIKSAFVPLIVGTIPFVARQMESAMEEIPGGIVEASISMGMSPWQIIKNVYLKQNIPGMIRGMTITLIAVIGQIAIVGTVGAGGLGDLAIRFGWQRQMTDITYVVLILLLIIISVIQFFGDWLVRKTTH